MHQILEHWNWSAAKLCGYWQSSVRTAVVTFREGAAQQSWLRGEPAVFVEIPNDAEDEGAERAHFASATLGDFARRSDGVLGSGGRNA